MLKIVVGVDPGWSSGGMAALALSGSIVGASKFNGLTTQEIWDLFYHPMGRDDCVVVWSILEKVNAFPGQGRSSIFKFGGSYYALWMAMTAAGYPRARVGPGKWQRSMGAQKRGKDEPKVDHKRRLRAMAQELWPHTKLITNATADALLLAEYARREYLETHPEY